jgi:hypothetical protein
MNIRAWFKKAAAKLAALKIVRIFFGVGAEDADSSGIGKKVGKVALANILYRYSEYLLMGLAFGIVSAMKYYAFSELTIFFVLWFMTIIDTSPGVFLNDWLKVDITAREGQRRWLDALYAKSGRITFILLVLFEIGFCVYEIIWSGPEWFFLFFRSRIANWPRWAKAALYVAVAGIQMTVWTKIYCLGYESVSELVKHYWK